MFVSSGRRGPISLSLVVMVAWLAAGGLRSPGLSAQAAPSAQRPITLPPAFASILRAYELAWTARDEDALAALFTEDGFVLRPGHPPVRGRARIRAAYEQSGGPLVLRGYSYAMADSVGYIVGGFARRPEDPDLGKFVLALRRIGTVWLIAADMDNGNGP